MQNYNMQTWEIVARVLEKAIVHMPISNEPERITVFHSRKAPSISILNYLARIHQLAHCSESCFIVAFIYIDRLLQKNPEFPLNSLSIHRLILACVFMAIKFNDDIYYDNAFYARLGGITLEEMNYLEVGILSYLQFDLFIAPGLYYDYVAELTNHCCDPAVETLSQPMECDSCKEKTVSSAPSNGSIETTPSNGEINEN